MSYWLQPSYTIAPTDLLWVKLFINLNRWSSLYGTHMRVYATLQGFWRDLRRWLHDIVTRHLPSTLHSLYSIQFQCALFDPYTINILYWPVIHYSFNDLLICTANRFLLWRQRRPILKLCFFSVSKIVTYILTTVCANNMVGLYKYVHDTAVTDCTYMYADCWFWMLSKCVCDVMWYRT